jgi:hypothetical protein
MEFMTFWLICSAIMFVGSAIFLFRHKNVTDDMVSNACLFTVLGGFVLPVIILLGLALIPISALHYVYRKIGGIQ